MSPQKSPFVTWLRQRARLPFTALLVTLSPLLPSSVQAATVDWGVSQSGQPGAYTWQHLYNWNLGGSHQSPLFIPNAIGDIANLNLVNLTSNQIINLDGAVTLGTLNIGDTSGQQSYIIAAGTGGTLTFNGGASSGLNKSGIGTDVITSNIALTGVAPLTITANDGLLALTGVISGAGGITKDGVGTLIMRGTNTYTGVTTINNGMLIDIPTANDGAVLGSITAGNNTVVNSGGTLAFGPDAAGAGAIGNPAEPITINGSGFRNNGALRNFMGTNGATINGLVTMGSAARVQNDLAGTLTLSAANVIDQTLTAGGIGFVSYGGQVSGAGTINHFGLSGFRMTGVGAGQNYSGTINSNLGEIRSDTGNATLANTPYNDVAALNLKDSWLRISFGNAAGAPAAGDSPNSRFSTTAPITMAGSQIYIDNASFSATTTNFYDYAVVQGFGATTINSGHNRIGFRSADAGSVTMTFADLQKPNPGTTLELLVDSLSGTALGAGTKHRILNSAIGADVPFVGGWAYTYTGTAGTGGEFVKYDFTGGNGYTAITGSLTAITGATGTDNVRRTTAESGFGAVALNSLNIAGGVTIGTAGDTLDIVSGGLMSSSGTNTIAATSITSSGGTLYDIAIASHNISADITGAIDFVKTGGGTTSMLTANTYTGTTYINEGVFRGVIGSKAVSLGSGNLVFGGSPNVQSAYENDADFVRALGAGAGQVQLIGGGGLGGGSSGFNAYGAPIKVNFGGVGATVVWGSSTFDPGIYGLNVGGASTHAVTLVNNYDLGGEQRYIRVDGGGSGTERGAQVVVGGDLFNGSIVKRGGGTLRFETPTTYEGGTIVNQGQFWLRGTGTAGANVIGNDIQVGPDAYLRIESPDNIGSRQMIILQNNDVNTPAVVSFGAGYGTGTDITFSSLTATGGIPGTGGNNVLIANNQSGQARRVAVTISGNHNFQNDVLGQIRAVAPNVEAWFGADNGNGTFTGATLSPSGGAVSAYRLGGHTNNGGTLTIANANVLTDALLGAPTPLIVGAPDQTDRNYTDGTIWIPQSQSYTGQITIGQGGILWAGQNGALGGGAADILLRAGELRLDVADGSFGGAVGTQYSARNINISAATGTIRTSTLDGGGFNTVQLGNLTFDANRTLQVLSIGTNFTDLAVNNIIFANSANTISLAVGNDNSFQAGVGMMTVNGIIGDQATGAQGLQKLNGGVLVLNSDNTYDGTTGVQQGRLVLGHVGAAGTAASSLQFNSNNDRTAQIEFRLNGAGPHTIANATMTTGTGGNDNSTRIITVGPNGPGSEDATVILPALTIAHAGAYTVGGGTSSALYFDGFNGYKIEIPSLVLGRDINLRTRGALTTITGVVSGAAGFDLEKHEQGTLWLNGNNTFDGTTTISNGYLVLGHDNALGVSTTDVTFRNNVFSQILATGTRTISRNFINTATGGIQSLGGLDAGAKLFTGNVNMSTRGMSLTAITGGDTTFSGVITDGAGIFGLQKEGNGTVILAPSTGTGNTYDGTTTVVQGTLIGQAQATSGSPFGTGAITMADGDIRLLGLAGATTTTAGILTTGGGARVGVDATAGGATTFTFASLTRTGSGSITFEPTTGSLNTNEIFTFTAPPTLVNTIVGPWAVHTASGVSNAASYVTMSGSNVVTATYGGTGNIDTVAGSTQVFDATGSGGTLTANRSVFAFRTDTNVDLGGFRLQVGDTGTPANGGGIILNNGADINGMAGSRINIEDTALSIYVDDAAVSSLNVPVRNFRNNVNNTLTTVFSKFGPGTLEIGAVQQFEGNIELNRGTLSLTAPNVFPFFSNLNGTTGSVVIMSPGTTIDLNNNNQEFGNLSGVNPSNAFQFSAGTINLGTATLTVGREDSNQTFNGRIIGGAGSTLQKVGAGRLILDNINSNVPSTVEIVQIDRGILQTWVNDNSWATPTPNASAIPSTTTVYLRGGEWEVRAIGDSTGNAQRINIGNNVIHQGGDSIFDTDRATGGGSNKLLTFNNLTLDVQRFLITGGNSFIPRFDGTITMTNHTRVQTDASGVFAGTITDGGKGYTMNKIGGSDLVIGGDSSATWTGGLVVTGGTLLFGTRGLDDIRSPGTTFVPTSTANAGSGDIIVNLGSAIRLTAPSNILTAQGQEVRVYGAGEASTTRVDLLTDAAITSYGLRSLTDGAIALGLSEGTWSTPLNQAKFGNGTWGLSALSNTLYTPTTLGAGVNNVYAFYGTNAGTLSIANSNVLTGTASVELGKSPVFAGTNPANTTSIIRFYGDQNYTGNTTIFRGADAGGIGSFLELTGDSASPVFDVYGRLTLRGDGRATNDAGTQVNTVNLRPGGNLRLDYSMDVADYAFISRLNESNLGLASDENKWGDSTALVLDGAGINLINSSGRVNQETVGAITVKGGAGITLERNGTAGQIVLQAPSITRSGQSTLTVRENANELGSVNLQSMKLILTGGAPTLTNGIVAPWMINATRRTFLSYNADTGFINAPFAAGTPTLGGGDAYLGTFTGTEIVQFAGAWGDTTLTGTKNVYALRVDEESGTNDMVFTGGQINIHSGGLILGSDDSNRVNFDTTAIYFGDGAAPVEGIVYGGHSTPNSRFGGIVTATNLTFDGPGGFHVTNTANAITGTIQLNGGRLYLDGAGTQGTASEIILHGNYANNFNGNQMPDLRLRHNSATTTFTGLTVTVAENVPQATIQAERFTGAGTTTAVQFQNLNILGTTGPAGTLLRLNNSNSNTDVLGTTTIGGTSDVGMNVNANTWRLIGSITSAAQIVKTGDGVLRFDGDNSGFTGGFVLNRGEWRLTAGTAANLDVAGTGDVDLNFGVLRLAQNGASGVFTAAGQDISVNGQVTIITDRNGGATAATRTIGVNNLGNVFRTTNSPYVIWQAASFGDDIILENILEINGSPTHRTDSTDLFLRDLVIGSGTFNKAGIWYLHFDNNAANTFSGGFNNFTGVTAVRQVNATLGTGPVNVFAGTALSIPNTTNLGGGAFKVYSSGTAAPVIGTRTIANFNAITAAVAAAASGTGNGVLSIDANQSLAVDPAMNTRDGGAFSQWFLGGGEGNGNLTANSVTPWGTGGTQFRLGGGFSTLTVGPATAGSDQLAGIGNSLVVGMADTVGGYGTLTFNANGNNTFDGGTLVTRSRNLDGGYRGHVLSVQGGANGTGATFRTPLGTGQIDVYGDMRYEGASGTAANSATTNANVVVVHSARLRFDNNTPFTGSGTTGTQTGGTIGGGGRWADTAGITLYTGVIDMVGDNTDHAANKEIIGDITFHGGSEVVVRRSTGFGAELITSDLVRGSTNATLMLRHDADLLGDAGSVNTDRFIINAWSGGSPIQNNNMVDPWIISRSQNQFLKYDTTLGFQIITEGTTPANYLTSAGGTIDGTLLTANNGTEILNLATATGTLGANLDVHALRTDRDINSSADNAFDRITIRSGGLVQAGNTPTINPDLYFGSAGDGTGQALIWATNNTLQINGKIFASEVVKSGTAFLSIRSDQPQFTGNWTVNGGGIQFLTPNSQSTGQVILQGAHMTDNDNTFQISEVRYNFNSGTPDLFTWGGGKITVNDMGIVRSIATNDRLEQIPAIDLKSTGGGHNGIVFLQSDASRHTVRTGTVTLFDHYVISTDATSFGPGSTSGFQLGSGTGTGGLNNQGLYDVRFSGDGIVSLGDNSASFTGARTMGVGDATVRVLHNGAFGAATATATVNSTGVIEIATANFTPTATLIQSPGSIERWAQSDARGTGNFTFGNGVHWQVFTDVAGTRTIDLAGGSIMGYLPLDYDQVAVIQTIRSGVTVNLSADSFLGQIYPAGTSNGSNHFIYDMGKLNTSTNLNPSDNGLRGSYLVIDGSITGNFTMTKVGQDVIKLAGSNTFTGLNIENGIIQLGRNNALSTTVAVTTRGEGNVGILDLNGYNQEIGSLSGPSGSINNSAFDNNTLIVNQTASTIYGGSIGGSVTVTKEGAGTLTFTGVNDYQGGTNLNGGTISVSQDISLGRVHLTPRADSLRFNGGSLQTTANVTISANRGITLDASGGILAPTSGTTLGIDSIISGAGTLSIGDTGTVQLNNTANDYTGLTGIFAGTLQPGAVDALAPRSRHSLNGDFFTGAMSLNGFNQTIGSLASTGPGAAGTVVALGGSMLSMGADGTQDAMYAGVITGGGTAVFRLNGNGAVQMLFAADNSAQGWNTEVANGVLTVANDAKLGSGSVNLGVAGVSGADDLTALRLQNTSTFANNITVNTANGTGSAFITSSIVDATISGTVTLNRDTFSGAEATTTLSMTNMVSGDGRITVIGGGTLRLTSANSHGAAAGTSGTAIDGGTIVRAGTLLLENNTAAGSQAIELGDTISTIGAAVDRATFASILGSGSFNPNSDGLTATSGGQNVGGTTGFGAFIAVSTVIDGFDYSSSALGTRILVAGEEANPERNGIYTIAAINGGTMNLVRADDFETSNQMRYGGQVAVTSGTYGGRTMFMYEENIVVRNETTLEPVRFRTDVLNPNVSVMANVTGLTIANNIDINANISTGTTTLGGSAALSAATDTGVFSGNIRLQNLQAGVSEARTLQLASSVAATSGAGITFSGIIGEVDATPVTGDVLSITKVDAGVATLTGANTYTGTTTVAGGTLLVSNATGSATGLGSVMVNASTTLGGTGFIAPAANNSITLNGTFAPGSLGGITGEDIALTVSGAGNISFNAAATFEIFSRTAGANPASANDKAAISAADWSNILFGGSSVLNVVDTTGTSLTWQSGDSWLLFDWTGIGGGTPGSFGALNLPALDTGLLWDTSGLYTTGSIVVAVPEPGRLLCLMLGVVGFISRRRRCSL